MADKPLCMIPDCDKPSAAKKMCWKHYERVRKYGDHRFTKSAPNGALAEFLNWAASQSVSHCILWPYGTETDGYGVLRVDGKMALAHRTVLEASAGPPPAEGMHAAHCPITCSHKNCVNPLHLRWATASENEFDKHISQKMAS